MTIPALNSLWRPNGEDATVDDRELIRQYADKPATEINLNRLTVAMNEIATVSTAAVVQIQGWIDEIQDLESAWASKIAAGTAHLSNVQSYEGPAPGVTIDRDSQLRKADVLEWDTDLLKVKIQAGGAAGTEGAVVAGRMADLKGRVLKAIGFDDAYSGYAARLLRS